MWTRTTNQIEEEIKKSLDRYGGVYMMANSGAKGNISQIRQMAGMTGPDDRSFGTHYPVPDQGQLPGRACR